MPRIFKSESPYGGSPHVFLATAAYQFHPNYTHSLAKAMPILMQAGIAVDLCHIADDCHVDDARNALVRQFLMSKADALIFIDNDVGFEADDLVKLCRHDRDIVAGVYPCKEMIESYPVRVAAGIDLQADADGLVEVEGLPTGFMKIKREVLEKMCAIEPRKYYGRGQSHDDIPHTILFERTYENGGRFSGDYAFCEKWKAMGGKLFADPEMKFTHCGAFEWSGSLGDHWKRTYGVYARENEEKFAQAVETLRAGNPSIEVMRDLEAGWSNTRWAAQASLLMTVYLSAKKHPGEILECGSGLSSFVMGLAVEGRGTVNCLEHDPIWASKLVNTCKKFGLANVKVNLCPLVDFAAGRWYQTPDLPDHFSLVFNDGPPRTEANRAIVYEQLGRRMNGSPVIADDAEDQDELDALKDWSRANGRTVNTLGKDRLFAVSTLTP